VLKTVDKNYTGMFELCCFIRTSVSVRRRSQSPGAREVSGSNSHCWQFSVSRKSFRYVYLGTGCTFTTNVRVDSAFHCPRDGKWVSTLWL